MSVRKTFLCSAAVLLMVLLLVCPSRSQPGQRGPGGPPPSPEEIRKTVIERLKEKLNATEEDWKALEPKISNMLKLLEQTRAMDGVRMLGTLLGPPGQGPGGPGGGPPNATERDRDETVVGKSLTMLKETLESSNASSEQIREKLGAFRKARKEAAQQLAKAEQELRAVLTARQETQLVVVGMLE